MKIKFKIKVRITSDREVDPEEIVEDIEKYFNKKVLGKMDTVEITYVEED